MATRQGQLGAGVPCHLSSWRCVALSSCSGKNLTGRGRGVSKKRPWGLWWFASVTPHPNSLAWNHSFPH